MSLLEAAFVQVGVDLRGGHAGVAKHFLDYAQVTAVVKEMGGKTVTESVRGKMFGNASSTRVFLDQMPDGFTAERAATRGEEDFTACRGAAAQPGTGVDKVLAHAIRSLSADGHEAFFVAFADGAQKGGVEIDVAEAELGSFAHTESCGIHQLKDCFVTEAEFSAGMGGSQEAFYFGIVKRMGQETPEFGRVDGLGRIGRK